MCCSDELSTIHTVVDRICCLGLKEKGSFEGRGREWGLGWCFFNGWQLVVNIAESEAYWANLELSGQLHLCFSIKERIFNTNKSQS